MVVFESADLDSAVEGVVDAIWFNQGQVRGPVYRIIQRLRFTSSLLFIFNIINVHV